MRQIMPEFTSDSELACEDYCIYDARYNCKLCSRLTNTRYWRNKMAREFWLKVITSVLQDIHSMAKPEYVLDKILERIQVETTESQIHNFYLENLNIKIELSLEE
jgi:hypothetical protein